MPRSPLLAPLLLAFPAAAALAQSAPLASAPKPWVALVDTQLTTQVDIGHAGPLTGSYQRSRSGFEVVHEGPDHALDFEAYRYRHEMKGSLAADPERAYGDTTDIILSGFVQGELAGGDRLQLIGAVEWAAAEELGLDRGFRWGIGGAYRWKQEGEWDVALGLMVQDRFEMSPLPIPYLRAYWHLAPDLRVEFRATGLQNGVFARWFATEDKATTLDLAVAYETLTFRLADNAAGPRAVAIGEVPIRLGLTQFLDPAGTWFVRLALSHDVFRRHSFRRDGEPVAAFQSDGASSLTLRVGARF